MRGLGGEWTRWMLAVAVLLAVGATTTTVADGADDSEGSEGESMESLTREQLEDLATRYAAAWSGGDPDALAAFYAEGGSLKVNDGEPSVGREAISATAASFMEAFPDMVVVMESVSGEGARATFHWHWTGSNTGPGGTGRSVDLRGYEEWTLSPEGLIEQSLGHYDAAEYERQLDGDG